jgi:hypothetical protein
MKTAGTLHEKKNRLGGRDSCFGKEDMTAMIKRYYTPNLQRNIFGKWEESSMRLNG